MSVRRTHQRDLFESKQTLPEMLPDQRGKVMVLLQAFLLEPPSSARSTRTLRRTRRQAMTKIAPEHLARGAFDYIRQSTSDQVLNNHESRRRQYGLADRARALGWSTVEVIDDDLGRSGSGISRPGFEKLLAAICEGRVGAVVSIEASRLARNGRDWHTLLEFCGLVGTLLLDEDGIYDPRHPNDRLLLGMKGTMSEMELSLFRQRSLEALKQKARRGELFLNVAVGYLKTSRERIEKDPDRRVQEAITLVFRKFAELQTVRQVHLWLRQERLPLPAVGHGPEGRRVAWKLPVYNTQGGDHTATNVRKNRAGQHRWGTAADVVELVTVLARQMPDQAIAAVLNRAGKRTGRGNGWTRSRVCFLRNHRGIAPYRDGERAERGEVTLDEAAAVLVVSAATVRRLIREGTLPAGQLCRGAPWVIRADDLVRPEIKRLADQRRLRRPPSGDPRQNEIGI